MCATRAAPSLRARRSMSGRVGSLCVPTHPHPQERGAEAETRLLTSDCLLQVERALASRRWHLRLTAFPIMEGVARRVLLGKLTKIKESKFDPVWLAEELFVAGIVGEEERTAAGDETLPRERQQDELLDLVLGNGGEGVFQTIVNIFHSKLHTRWLATALKGRLTDCRPFCEKMKDQGILGVLEINA